MRAVVQRVTESDVTAAGAVTGSIGQGLMVLLGVETGDTEEDAAWMAKKISGLRIFADEAGKMNCSVRDVGGDVLVVSQFTLLGDCRKGNRPGFTAAAAPEEAKRLYRHLTELLRQAGLQVAEGVFQAEMQVRIHNDGPVTLLLDSRRLF